MEQSEQSNPSWYESLQGDPIRERMFTDQAAAAVRRSAVTAGSRQRRGLHSYIFAAVVSFSAILVFYFAMNQGDGLLNDSSGDPFQIIAQGHQAEHGNEPAGDNFSAVNPEDMEYTISGPVDHVLKVREPSDSEWQSFVTEIEEKNGTGQYYNIEKKKLLAKKQIGDAQTFLFMKDSNDIGFIKTSFYVFEWGDRWIPYSYSPASGYRGVSGWKNQSIITVRYELEELNKLQNRGFEMKYHRMNELSMFVGLSANEDITAVRITDNENNVHQADILLNEDGIAYWFFSAIDTAGLYQVEAMNADGMAISKQYIAAN